MSRISDLLIDDGPAIAGSVNPLSLCSVAQANELRDELIQYRRLIAAVETLPRTTEEMYAWFDDHGLNRSCGPGNILSAVRADLREAAGLDDTEETK